MKKETVVTRPALAGVLMQAGYEGRQIANPYNPKLVAWSFTLDEDGQSMVSTYYRNLKEIQKGGDIT